MTIEQVMETAQAHHQAGRLGDAEKLYRQVLARQPTHVNALHLLAVLAGQSGHYESAIELTARAIKLVPDNSTLYCNLGEFYRRAGRLNEAVATFHRAISLQADNAEARNNLGITLKDLGRFNEAVAAYRQAINLRPNYPEAHFNLGAAIMEKGQLVEAIAAYRQATVLRPGYLQAQINLGNALTDDGQLDQALAVFAQALSIDADCPEAHLNLGVALKYQAKLEQALTAFSRAIELKPDMAEAHHNRAQVLLLLGDLPGGWQEYEWRWKTKGHLTERPFNQPQWTGQDLNGQTILLHAEQGLGDTIHFIRYAPLLAERGAKVLLVCQSHLDRLMKHVPGVQAVFNSEEVLPSYNFHSPLMSLPLAFGTKLETIPANVPYLQFSHNRKLPLSQQHIGVVWAGSPGNKNDRNRSMPLKYLKPLATVSACFHSLQIGPATQQMASVPELKLIDHSAKLKLIDTAELIHDLDLVITVDTSVAHLAGAMGKPVWVMLPFAPDWRWLLDREDSPWYPTMRLFRQRAGGDWSGVVEQMVKALQERCG